MGVSVGSVSFSLTADVADAEKNIEDLKQEIIDLRREMIGAGDVAKKALKEALNEMRVEAAQAQLDLSKLKKEAQELADIEKKAAKDIEEAGKAEAAAAKERAKAREAELRNVEKSQAAAEKKAAAEAVKELADAEAAAAVEAASMAAGFVAVVSALADFTVNSISAALSLEKLSSNLSVVATNAGISSEHLQDVKSSLDAMGGSSAATDTLLTNLTRSGIDIAQSQGLMRVAMDASAISGRNLDDTVRAISLGVEEHNTRILKNVGIVFDSRRAYTEYAEQLHKTVAQLTDLERTEAIAAAVQKNGQAITGAYAASLTTASGQIREMNKEILRLEQSFGTFFLPALREGASLLATLASAATEATNAFAKTILPDTSWMQRKNSPEEESIAKEAKLMESSYEESLKVLEEFQKERVKKWQTADQQILTNYLDIQRRLDQGHLSDEQIAKEAKRRIDEQKQSILNAASAQVGSQESIRNGAGFLVGNAGGIKNEAQANIDRIISGAKKAIQDLDEQQKKVEEDLKKKQDARDKILGLNDAALTEKQQELAEKRINMRKREAAELNGDSLKIQEALEKITEAYQKARRAQAEEDREQGELRGNLGNAIKDVTTKTKERAQKRDAGTLTEEEDRKYTEEIDRLNKLIAKTKDQLDQRKKYWLLSEDEIGLEVGVKEAALTKIMQEELDKRVKAEQQRALDVQKITDEITNTKLAAMQREKTEREKNAKAQNEIDEFVGKRQLDRTQRKSGVRGLDELFNLYKTFEGQYNKATNDSQFGSLDQEFEKSLTELKQKNYGLQNRNNPQAKELDKQIKVYTDKLEADKEKRRKQLDEDKTVEDGKQAKEKERLNILNQQLTRAQQELQVAQDRLKVLDETIAKERILQQIRGNAPVAAGLGVFPGLGDAVAGTGAGLFAAGKQALGGIRNAINAPIAPEPAQVLNGPVGGGNGPLLGGAPNNVIGAGVAALNNLIPGAAGALAALFDRIGQGPAIAPQNLLAGGGQGPLIAGGNRRLPAGPGAPVRFQGAAGDIFNPAAGLQPDAPVNPVAGLRPAAGNPVLQHQKKAVDIAKEMAKEAGITNKETLKLLDELIKENNKAVANEKKTVQSFKQAANRINKR